MITQGLRGGEPVLLKKMVKSKRDVFDYCHVWCLGEHTKTQFRRFGEAQLRLRLMLILDICKINFHTVMLLQCKVCALMVSIGGEKVHFLIVSVVPRDGI